MLSKLAEIASSRGCKRMEWAVLDWNTPRRSFTRRLAADRTDGTCGGWWGIRSRGSQVSASESMQGATARRLGAKPCGCSGIVTFTLLDRRAGHAVSPRAGIRRLKSRACAAPLRAGLFRVTARCCVRSLWRRPGPRRPTLRGVTNKWRIEGLAGAAPAVEVGFHPRPVVVVVGDNAQFAAGDEAAEHLFKEAVLHDAVLVVLGLRPGSE